MKKDWTEINKHRVRHGEMTSQDSEGRYGAFTIKAGRVGFIIIAASGDGEANIEWEHVSVRAIDLSPKGKPKNERIPTWAEMCFVKDLFFEKDETVVQFHPEKREYVNDHGFVLHLWKHRTKPHELPPKIFV